MYKTMKARYRPNGCLCTDVHIISFYCFFWGGEGSDVPKNSGMQALFVKEQGRQ